MLRAKVSIPACIWESISARVTSVGGWKYGGWKAATIRCDGGR